MLGLSRARVIQYIPRRTCPSVTFVRHRLDTSRIIITPAVYESRRESYAQRIEAMKEYVLAENECRSRILLRYFGEHEALPCLVCDNCRKQRTSTLTETNYNAYKETIYKLLSDKQPHSLEELYTLRIGSTQLKQLLQRLIEEEKITLHDGKICMK